MSVHIDACVCIYMHLYALAGVLKTHKGWCGLKTQKQEASVLNTHNQQAYTHILCLLYTHPLPPSPTSSASLTQSMPLGRDESVEAHVEAWCGGVYRFDVEGCMV